MIATDQIQSLVGAKRNIEQQIINLQMQLDAINVVLKHLEEEAQTDYEQEIEALMPE